MQTEYLKLDVNYKKAPELYRAAQFLAQSEIVAFPTETVYGLGAKVFNEEAIGKIFAAKNRAPGQSLLVHISKIEQVTEIAAEITRDTRLLMEMFWPGPLSIILPAHQQVPLVVTGGKATVGLRMPSHPVAKNLIDITGPLAATSANRSGRPSPLTAEHVREDLEGRIAAILDGGPTGLGIESTIIDLSQEPYSILRPGGVAGQALEAVLGKKLIMNKADLKKKSYQTDFVVVLAHDWEDFYRQLERYGQKAAGIVYYDEQLEISKINVKHQYILALNQNGSQFFSILRDAEQKKLEVLLLAPLPATINDTLWDRINRAAHYSEKGD